MNTLVDTPATARHENGKVVVRMTSGHEFSFQCSDYPRLRDASPEERSNVELSPLGIHWPDLDEDLSIAGLLRDHDAR